jgi:hypothetical protein
MVSIALPTSMNSAGFGALFIAFNTVDTDGVSAA